MGDEPKPLVLAVDDEPANLETLQRVFRKEFELTLASSAAAALQALAQRPFDVILADYAMPEKNGLQLLEEVRTAYPTVNRVLLTAHSDLREVRNASGSGLTSSLVAKPWEKEQLLTLVTSLARLARVRREMTKQHGSAPMSAADREVLVVPAQFSPEDEAAWTKTRLEREKQIGSALALYALVAYASYAALDWLFEPRWFSTFLIVRFSYCVYAIAAFVLIRRARTLASTQWVVGLLFALAGMGVSFMLPRIENQYAFYVIGFSIIFWAAGAVNAWPVGVSSASFGAILLAYAVAHLTHDGPRTGGEIIGAVFYVVAAAVFSVISSALRLRTERRAFWSAHQLSRKNQELGTALASLEDAQARLVASEKLSALGRLLAGLSHEINNPINVIHNNLGPVREYVDTFGTLLTQARKDAPEGAGFHQQWKELDADFVLGDCAAAVKTVQTAEQRLQAVHRDLRAFIRGDAPMMEQGNLNEGIETTATMLARSLPTGVKLRCELQPLPQTWFQPGQLNQVWLNLLQNAVDAVGQDGEIVAESRVLPDALEISVRDNGPGIDPKVRDKLFEPFVTTKGVGKGTGLGLAVSYRIIQNHEGTIRVDPSYSGGARFVVRLPLKTAAEAKPAELKAAG